MPEAPKLKSPITLLECSRPLFSLHNCFNFFEEKKECKLPHFLILLQDINMAQWF